MIEALYEIGAIQQKNDFLDEFVEDIGERNCFYAEIGKWKVRSA